MNTFGITQVYFDTNVFYGVVNGDISGGDYNALKSYFHKKHITKSYSPITFNEIVKHINSKESGRFHYYKKVLATIKDLCENEILEHPDYALAQILRVPPRNLNAKSYLNRYRDIICDHTSYKKLAVSKDFQICRNLVKGYLRLKREWMDRINKLHLWINPHYEEKRQKGRTTRVTDKLKREELMTYLESHEYRKRCIDATLLKATAIGDSGLVGAPKKDVIENLYSKLSAYFTAYKTISKKVVQAGYIVKENDYDDVHFLIYLGQSPYIRFVTYDDKLKRKIGGCWQERQMIKIDDLLRGM